MGESSDTPLKLQFDRRVRLDFRGATITSDAGLLACRELDAALGLTETANDYIHESRTGRNVQHRLLPLLRQSVYSRLAGYEDTNDAERLAQAGIPQIKPTFLDIVPSGIPSNIIPHSKGVKCGLIRSNSPFSYSNHRPAKPKIPKPLVYAQVSPLGTSFATP